MLEARKKISKKEMKEDKLVTSYYKAQSFVMENQARLLISAGIIAVLIVATILFVNKRANNNQTAATMLAKVMPLYDEGNYKEAINGVTAANIPGLKKIIEEYGSTEQGETAKIYLANSYSMTGNNDAAFEMYDDYSGSNDLFKASALSGKAGILETKKEYEKAAGLYKDASQIGKTNPSNAELLMKAGIAYLKAGNKEEAKIMFESVKKEYASFASMLEVDRYLAETEM